MYIHSSCTQIKMYSNKKKMALLFDKHLCDQCTQLEQNSSFHRKFVMLSYLLW